MKDPGTSKPYTDKDIDKLIEKLIQEGYSRKEAVRMAFRKAKQCRHKLRGNIDEAVRSVD